MEKYIWINTGRIKDASAKTMIDGIEFSIQLNPFDSPNAVTGSYNDKKGIFTIRFDYIDKEPARHADESIKGITFVEGRHTGKLLSITIPIDTAPLDGVAVISVQHKKLMSALETRGERIGDDIGAIGRRMNHDIASQVLQDDFSELVLTN